MTCSKSHSKRMAGPESWRLLTPVWDEVPGSVIAFEDLPSPQSLISLKDSFFSQLRIQAPIPLADGALEDLQCEMSPTPLWLLFVISLGGEMLGSFGDVASVESWRKITCGSSLRGLDILPVSHWHTSRSSHWHQEPTRQDLDQWERECSALSSSASQVMIKEGECLCLC